MTPDGGPRRPGGAALAVTMGEPAGIGGEIALKAWAARGGATPVFFLIDDAARLRGLAARLSLDVPIAGITAPEDAAAAFPTALPVLANPLAVPSEPGRIDPRNAAAVQASIETGVALAMAGRAAGVVTNPIHKACLYEAGFAFPGHTEFIAHLVDHPREPVMMLAGEDLRVVPVTRHLGLRAAIDKLTPALIVETAEITAEALTRDFGIARPRLAVAGLNPHAGESGEMGREEVDFIAGAIDQVRAGGIDARGPLPADTLFHEAARGGYDAALCMYHDQALIPIKTIAFDSAVNVTLGLPFVRTSPDHGTALDIAGTGEASEASLVSALRLAASMAARRAEAGV